MEKGLNLRERRELRIKRLNELEAEGKLASARNRLDITKMLGFSGGYDAGYTWISSIIKEKILDEIFLGFDKTGKAEYEYHMRSVPQAKPTPTPQVRVVGKPMVLSKPTCATATPKMVIRYKDLTIELENINYELVENIINKLADR